MERLKLRTALAGALILLSACDANVVRPTDKVTDIASGSSLLGPEAFPFCGGWVEVWAQKEPYRQLRLHLKLSPPANDRWHVWNSHVVIESGESFTGAIPFEVFRDFDTGDQRGNVTDWALADSTGFTGSSLKVALRPFDGCKGEQPIKGVVLKSGLPIVTR